MATVLDVAKYVLNHTGMITAMKLEKLVYCCQAWSLGWDEIETIQAVLNYYGDKWPHWLSELTHLESPWKEARKGVRDGEPSRTIISKDSMQQYYGGL